jgi:hypothetical protein
MPRRGEFRAFTDQMLDFIDRLRAAEEAKVAAPMGSAEFVQAAREAEALSRMAFRWPRCNSRWPSKCNREGNCLTSG